MESVPIGDSSPKSKTTTNQSPPEDDCIDEHLWGFLRPCCEALPRIDFWRTHSKYSIGRDTEKNAIILPALKISSVHCTITWDEAGPHGSNVLVTDMSSNGTWINGEKIGKNQTRILMDQSEIAFGACMPQPENTDEDYRFIFHLTAGKAVVYSTSLSGSYDIGTYLGKGKFATVYKAVHRASGRWFAVKMIATSKTASLGASRGFDRNLYLAREIDVMKRLDHRNICKLEEAFFEQDGGINLVLELAEKDNLLAYILQSDSGIEELPAKDISYQICDALAYMHARHITHRDLKPENILLARDSPPLIKLADFGLAKVLDNQTMLDTMCGTPAYIAPEVVVVSPSGYTDLVDSYSTGIVVFVMYIKRLPYLPDSVPHTPIARVRARQIDWTALNNTPQALSETAKSFIKALVEHNPHSRLSATAALQHPWLRQHIPFYGYAKEHHPVTATGNSDSATSSQADFESNDAERTVSSSLVSNTTHTIQQPQDDTGLRPSPRRSARLGGQKR